MSAMRLITDTEDKTAVSLLEGGLPLPVRAPLFFRLLGLKQLKCYQPCLGNKIRVSRLRIKMGITDEMIADISLEDADRLLLAHGLTLCRIIAIGMYKGLVFPWLFNRITGYWIMWNMKPKHICTVAYVMIAQSGTADFIDTTRCILRERILKPHLGQNPKKS